MVPDVSVIVPVYNVEQYLSRCINSILSQSLKNIEVILINDGSTDSSGRICEDFEKLDNRIRVIHKINGGLSDARNVGLDIANGKFIAFVDSDDFIHKEMYTILLKTIIENDCDIAESGYKKVYENEVIDDDHLIDIKKFYNKKAAVVSTIMDHHCKNYVWNKLYKKELWEKIRFPNGEIFEDVSTTYKIINNCTSIVKIDCVLYYYYQRQNSIVNSNFSLKKLDHCKALEGMMIFIEKEYLDVAPITSIKYFTIYLSLFQELLINRKRIEGSELLINNLADKLVNGKYNKYLKMDMELLCQQILINNYQIFKKQKILISTKLFLLRRSIWLFYSFNHLIKSIKKIFRQNHVI